MAPISGRGLRVTQTKDVVRTWFYWEFIVYTQKVLLLAMITLMPNLDPYIKLCVSLVFLISFLIMHELNEPYISASLNKLHRLAYTICILYVMLRLVIYAFEELKQEVLVEDQNPISIFSGEPLSEDLIAARQIFLNEGSGNFIEFLLWLWGFMFVYLLLMFSYACFCKDKSDKEEEE